MLAAETPLCLFFHGQASVRLFFVLSAFVLTYKFFKTKNYEYLSAGAIKRYFRLLGPVVFSLFITYILVNLSLVGKGGIGASEGFMFSLTLFPTVILALGIVRVVESRGGLLAAERIIRPLLRPLMGLPGYVGLAFISSFTTTDVGAVITRDLYDEGKLTDDERTIFVAYQYAASGTLANTINCGAPLMPISLLSFGIIFMVEIIVKIIGANIIRVYLAMKRKKAVGGAN